MRARLITCITVPLLLLLAVLGVTYGGGTAESSLQGMFLDRLGDATGFVPTARQGLVTDPLPVTVEQLHRYGEVYGIGAAVLTRTGEVVATNGLQVEHLDEEGRRRLDAALAKRGSELPTVVAPWRWGDLVVAEPILEAGDLVGAVVTSSPTDDMARRVLGQWVLLLGLAGLAVVLAAMFVWWLAGWVLRPVHRVGDAMTEMLHGHMEARIEERSGPHELRRIMTVFNDMADEVEQMVTRQQEFVSNAAHELRNPLNAMLLRIAHLSMGLDEEWADDVEQTREEGMRMARILDALETLAAEGLATKELQPVELGDVVANRLEAWRPAADARDVRLVFHPPSGDVACDGDELLIGQVLDTTLDNAVKFSPAGGTVTVEVKREETFVIVHVRDEGSGIPEAELPHAAERFWRSPRHHDVPGSGLGLAIAAELLTPLNGTLGVRNGSNGGLVVSLTFATPVTAA